jgi:putative phosphoesterase
MSSFVDVGSEFVGVLSDSHDNLDNVIKAMEILKKRDIKTILHLGDFVSPFTLLRFVSNGFRVIAVLGNNDGDKLGMMRIASLNNSEIHEPPHQLIIEGKKILMIHGKGSIEETREFAEALASSGKYDAVLYGHTHIIDSRIIRDTLLLNPGELYGKLTGKASLAILNIKDLSVEIITL